MDKGVCSEPDCDRPAHARGLCKNVHYSRWCRDKSNREQKQSFKLTQQENFLRFPLERESECLVWTRAKDDNGYGRVGGYQQGTAFAHRVSMEIKLKRRLSSQEEVLHTCDNPPCCNPEHLYVGTQVENTRDAMVRDRVAFGERHWKRVLTESDVRSIRARYKRGEATQVRMAAEYGVHKNTIYEAIHKGWRRVE